MERKVARRVAHRLPRIPRPRHRVRGYRYLRDDDSDATGSEAGGDSDRDVSCDNKDDSDHSGADKRAHHNALERKRRDHIKDSFHSLRDSVPSLQGEKASRAQILDKATEYIQYMRRKNHTHQQDIDDLKRQNALLEQQGERGRCAGGHTVTRGDTG
uniref:Protein max n=1 Tax=Nothoprocta perdicaria TaxID=30464 RepID=A0A8C7EHW3_NOTPE